MFSTLATILKDNWQWRKQIGRLAIFELVKKSRGAVLSWAWLFIKPGMYIFCFWFALEIGLRAGSTEPGAPPYFLWLCAGFIPWFFIQDMLGAGLNVYHRYSYLVNKIKFPLSAISTIYTGATMIVQLGLMVVLFIVYFACGMSLDIYLLQVPILLFLMFLFWNTVSILFSQLTAISKDVGNLMNAMSTPFFWLSGVIFDVQHINIEWIQVILYFNPITFFITSFRGAFYDKVWFWDDPLRLGCFLFVFVVTVIMALIAYRRLSEEVADVL